MWGKNQGSSITWKLVKNTDSQGPPQTHWIQIWFWSDSWAHECLQRASLHDPLSWPTLGCTNSDQPNKLALFTLKTGLLCRVAVPALKWGVTLWFVFVQLFRVAVHTRFPMGLLHLGNLKKKKNPKQLTIAYFFSWISSKWTYLCFENICSCKGDALFPWENWLPSWHDNAICISEADGSRSMVPGNRHLLDSNQFQCFIFSRWAKKILHGIPFYKAA